MPDQKPLSLALGDDEPIRCPRCGSDGGMHFNEVTLIDPAGDVYPLHADGDDGVSVVSATIGNDAATGQRHLVVLPHWCSECGERGQVVLQHENGRTVSRFRDLASTTS